MPAHQPTRIAIAATRHWRLDPVVSMSRRRSLPRHHHQLPRVLTVVRGVILVLALLLSVAASPTAGPPTAGLPTPAATAGDTNLPTIAISTAINTAATNTAATNTAATNTAAINTAVINTAADPPLPPPNPGVGPGCVLTDLGGCITGAIDTFLQSVLTDALNPLLGMLSDTLLTTPTPDQLPQLRELWERSWQLLLTVYSLFILLAGVLLMGYESVQTRYSVREIAPRLMFGFLAGALSLTVAGFAVDTANALATALLDGGIDPHSGAVGLRQLLTSAVSTDNGALFLLLLGFAVVVALVVVLLGYVVRVLLTVILIAGAPIALMFHALPQTEGIASWWWRTFGACLAIQVVQSLTLVTALNLLLTPGRGFSVFTEPGQGADPIRRCRPCSWCWRCCSSCAGSRSGCWPAAGSDRAGR